MRIDYEGGIECLDAEDRMVKRGSKSRIKRKATVAFGGYSGGTKLYPHELLRTFELAGDG